MKSRLIAAACLLLALSVAGAALAGEKKIDVQGSTTVLPIMQKEVEAYMAAHPDVALSVSGGGSGNGIKAIVDGNTDLAMASRDMKEKEVALAKEKGRNPVRTTIAIDALIPVVHPANAVSGLTEEQLKKIYTGEIKNWKEVGGIDKPIVVVSRDTSSGTYECWEEKILKGARVFPGALLQASNGAVVQAVSKNQNAIGYIGLGYLDKSIKEVDVDGVKGTPETAISGKYPIARELYLFTNGKPEGQLADFIAFILSPKGQELVKDAGYVPLKK